MPQATGYWYPSQYNTSATTTQYIYPQNGWYQTSTAITTNQYIVPTLTSSPNTTWVMPQTSNSYADRVWQQWVVMGQETMYQTPVMNPEAVAEAQRRMQEERRERQAACARARTLLEGFLDDEQKVELEQHGSFHVTGSKGRRYCIRTSGQAGNVDLLAQDGRVQARLCCHPRGGLPDGDAWLMQMIEIRHDEDHFLRTANVHRGALPTDVHRELIAA